MSSPRGRMLRLLSLLQTGRQWSAPDLSHAVGVTPRTLRRDIDELRGLGYPVQAARGPGGHYQLVAGRALPPLMFEDDEALATVLGLRLITDDLTHPGGIAEAANRASHKIRRLLPPRLRRTTDQALAAMDLDPDARSIPAPTILSQCAEAIAAHHRLTFDYGEPPHTREVEPARLVQIRRRWYLFAWDCWRDDWRTFRLDRIAAVPSTGAVFTPRPLPADDLQKYLRAQFFGDPLHEVVLTLHASIEQAAARLYRVDGTLEEVSAARCRYCAYVDSHEWLALVLLVSDLEFSVESPDSFRDYVRAQAKRLLRGASRR